VTIRLRVSRGRQALRKLMDRRPGTEAASAAAITSAVPNLQGLVSEDEPAQNSRRVPA
jgi:hypothetical protein